ncbi:hypothetical protein BDR06DRAFT_651958 [Suillus hirtellus]|nr:hypothetical protein BDR06DRAFT_651958 [Suillus hirtellus]
MCVLIATGATHIPTSAASQYLMCIAANMFTTHQSNDVFKGHVLICKRYVASSIRLRFFLFYLSFRPYSQWRN